MKTSYLGAILGFLIALPTWADEMVTSSEDVQIGRAARERSYPGGRDEEDLEVRSQVVKPIRKMGGLPESVESPANDDEF
jgi:hypothetical protein